MLNNKFTIQGNMLKTDSGLIVPEDEPVYILRASDRRALAAIVCYQLLCPIGLERDTLQEFIEQFKSFRCTHPDQMVWPEERY